MPPSLNSNQRPSALAFILFLTPSPLFAQGMLPPAAVSGETLVLSPFTVQADTEKGYLATQTLNGTRLRTDIKDIGSALTIFTEQLMDDLGATSINDLMAFAPNTDPFVATTADVSGNGNDFIIGNQAPGKQPLPGFFDGLPPYLRFLLGTATRGKQDGGFFKFTSDQFTLR